MKKPQARSKKNVMQKIAVALAFDDEAMTKKIENSHSSDAPTHLRQNAEVPRLKRGSNHPLNLALRCDSVSAPSGSVRESVRRRGSLADCDEKEGGRSTNDSALFLETPRQRFAPGR